MINRMISSIVRFARGVDAAWAFADELQTNARLDKHPRCSFGRCWPVEWLSRLNPPRFVFRGHHLTRQAVAFSLS